MLEEVRSDFMEFGGMSVLEISHRSKEFESVLQEVKVLLTELLKIPSGYSILFLQGGASHQFAMIPLNLMDKRSSYSITGYWSKRALSEASSIGETQIAFSSEGENFKRTPRRDEVIPDESSSFLHITSNNTIYGTQYREFPETKNIPLIADMSSDILSRGIEVSNFGLIYAGAQKNLGPAGVTLVIIRDDLIKRSYRKLPIILRYSTHAENNSLYNTPPVFAIYIINLVLRWLKRQGGVKKIEEINSKKAELIYKTLDNSSFYKGIAETESRSKMNVVFKLPDAKLEERFTDEAKKAGMTGLKGHRVIGGIRVSIYNACPMEWVETLVDFMKEFERKI